MILPEAREPILLVMAIAPFPPSEKQGVEAFAALNRIAIRAAPAGNAGSTARATPPKIIVPAEWLNPS
jgi:hypothetical protein